VKLEERRGRRTIDQDERRFQLWIGLRVEFGQVSIPWSDSACPISRLALAFRMVEKIV
jgi:hypothetical protein